tara:strand:- start:2401 stop:2862 length:462 start_codon:yes stop_codon:yes gene_type:complete
MKGFEIKEITEKAKQGKYGIVYTSWNADIVQDLLNETKNELLNQGVLEKNIIVKEVPGAFELPLAAQFLVLEEASAVISLGAIIKGDTPHFDFISNACLDGLQNVALKTNVPIICGVLTTNTMDQAIERSHPDKMNKGKEFAISAMNMVDALN